MHLKIQDKMLSIFVEGSVLEFVDVIKTKLIMINYQSVPGLASNYEWNVYFKLLLSILLADGIGLESEGVEKVFDKRWNIHVLRVSESNNEM